MLRGAPDGARPDETLWISVEDLPPTASERRRRAQKNALVAFGFYGFAVAVVVLFAVLIRLRLDALSVLLLGAVVGAVGVVQLLSYSRMAERDARSDRALALTKVGSSPGSLFLAGEADLEIPWRLTGPPYVAADEWAWRFVLPYEDADGESCRERLGPAEMAAVLKLPHRPPWEVAPEFRHELAREFRVRGLPTPAEVESDAGERPESRST